MSESPFDFDRPFEHPFERVPVQPEGKNTLPPDLRDRVAVYTVHDGASIPRRYRFRADGTPLVDPAVLERDYIEARDWGANAVAERFASALGLRAYGRCRVARVLVDFNRFPGSTPANINQPLESLAIGRLYGSALDHDEKTSLLETCYDPISVELEHILDNRNLVGISIHTYDETHASKTQRADLSLVSLPLSYQRESRLTYGVFDPMFPDHLAESTCSRLLRDRVSLNLERSGFRVVHNHPYAVPDGGIEMRAQVWHFFRYLRTRFEAAFPDTIGVPAFDDVWTMLLDTNLRLAEAEDMRSFLHRFRRVAEDKRDPMRAALAAYQQIARFRKESHVVRDYRRSPERPSSLGIEVRKDLVCKFDPKTGIPSRPGPEQLETVARIATAMAGALKTYFDTDRELYGDTRDSTRDAR